MSARDHSVRARGSGPIVPLLLVAFFLSGVAGLVYELVWIRSLGFVFGGSTAAVSTVLAAYMSGLAVGSAFLSRLGDRLRLHPFVLYGILEVGIALSALAVPLGVRAAGTLYYGSYGVGGPTTAGVLLRAIAIFAILIVPTCLMGATFPVIVKGATRMVKPGVRQRVVGGLYGLNTIGAALGVFLAGFYMLRFHGARATTLLAVVLNVGAAAIALLIAARSGSVAASGAVVDRKRVKKRTARSYVLPLWAILTTAFVAGFAALSCEVVWSRVLRLMLAGNTFSVSTMLIAFLVGIGLGSLIITSNRRDASPAVPFLLVGFGTFAALAIPLVFKSGDIFASIMRSLTGGGGGATWGQILVGRLGLASVIMLIPALMSGALFPILVSMVSEWRRSKGEAGAGETAGDRGYRASSGSRDGRLGTAGRVGAVYALNTIGAVFGSLLAGFVLIPTIGTRGTVILAASLLCGLGCFLFLRKRPTKSPLGAVALTIGVAVVVVVAVTHRGEYYLGKLAQGGPTRTLYYEEAVGASVIAVEDLGTGHIRLYTDGTFAVDTSFESQQTVAFLGHLPSLFAREHQSALVIGLGMGTTLASVASYPYEEITCVEIVPRVFDAARIFREYNYGVLDDPRVRTVAEDGRSYVAGSGLIYDVITCDPIHPAFGSPALYTIEYYELCRAHLAEGGVMAQYLPLHQLYPEDFRILLRTFSSVFPESIVFLGISHGVLIGSPSPLALDLDRVEAIFRDAGEGVPTGAAEIPPPGALLVDAGITSPAKLVASMVLDAASVHELSGEGHLNRDNHSVLEFSEGRSFGRDTKVENLALLLSVEPAYESILVADATDTRQEFSSELERAIVGRRHLLASTMSYFRGEQREALDEIRLADQTLPDDPEILYLGGPGLVTAYFWHARDLYESWRSTAEAGGAGGRDRAQLVEAELALLRAAELDPRSGEVSDLLARVRDALSQ